MLFRGSQKPTLNVLYLCRNLPPFQWHDPDRRYLDTVHMGFFRTHMQGEEVEQNYIDVYDWLLSWLRTPCRETVQSASYLQRSIMNCVGQVLRPWTATFRVWSIIHQYIWQRTSYISIDPADVTSRAQTGSSDMIIPKVTGWGGVAWLHSLPPPSFFTGREFLSMMQLNIFSEIQDNGSVEVLRSFGDTIKCIASQA